MLNLVHVIENLSGAADTYNLSTVASGSCSAATIYNDLDRDGVVDAREPAISSVNLANAAIAQIIVVNSASSGSCQINLSVNDGSNTKTATDVYIVLQSDSSVKINEIMYDPSSGNEWLELSNTSLIYPADLDNWVISDNDGNSYTIPASLAPMPPAAQCGGYEARLLVVFGSGVDETNWSDCLVTLYTGSSGWFEYSLDDISLCAGACDATTIVDYLAYGSDTATDDDHAVAAGLWSAQNYALNVDSGESLSRMRTPDLRDGYDANTHTDWYAANGASPGEENAPNIVINEIEFDGATVDWAELYIIEDGVAGVYGLDLSGYTLTDLDGSDTAFTSASVTVYSGEYLIIHWGAGTDETDSYCALNSCGACIDLYLADTAPNVSSDDGLALAASAGGPQFIDAVAWDGDGNATWCTGCGDGAVADGLWNGGFVNVTAAVGETIGRDRNSTDTNGDSVWAGTGGPDATQITYGYQNYTTMFYRAPTAIRLLSFGADSQASPGPILAAAILGLALLAGLASALAVTRNRIVQRSKTET